MAKKSRSFSNKSDNKSDKINREINRLEEERRKLQNDSNISDKERDKRLEAITKKLQNQNEVLKKITESYFSLDFENSFKEILTKFIKLYYDQGHAKNRWC